MKINFIQKFLLVVFAWLVILPSCKDEDVVASEDILNPVTITLEQFNTLKEDGTALYEGKWVRIENVQFTSLDAGQTFLGNRSIQDASGASAVVRTNSDRDFAYQLTPTGSGAIEGYVSRFTSSSGTATIQLMLRNLDGVAEMTGERFEITGIVTTLAEINANLSTYKGKIVTIENVQFDGADTSKVFNGTTSNGGGNRKLVDCDGNSTLVYTPANSALSNEKVPDGKGKITARVEEFNSASELILDAIPTAMTGERCGSTTTTCDISGTLTNISDVRALFSGSATTLSGDKKIKGVIISDAAGGNTGSLKNAVIQDATGGITVRFVSDHSFVLGDEVEINVDGVELSEFSGLLQLNNTPNAKACKTGTGTLPTPTVVTITQLNTGTYESTLVKLEGVTFSEAGQAFYGGSGSGTNRNISDGSNTIVSRISSFAAFKNEIIPSGSKNVTGIATDFNAAQLQIRNINDIQ